MRASWQPQPHGDLLNRSKSASYSHQTRSHSKENARPLERKRRILEACQGSNAKEPFNFDAYKVIVAGDLVSLYDVLSDNLEDPFNLEYFAKFLDKEFALELLLFWAEVEDLSAVPDSVVEAQCAHILQTYVLPGAPSEVNISSGCRAAARRHWGACYGPRPALPKALRADAARTLFLDAQAEVLAVLETDNFPRFRRAVQVTV
eukprot:CAMPEP_0194676148 /NCGR_PEP_ID=MMETSP0295-20121207/8696_1 /TAXON_ID=39354 /ORGANISM="Heterosigma akashiwo, Strain CCMP2393" /LENGTH=203 /DNA_ID=CAMNT_0039560649 /DNA_START=63 /DNA_END=670 /DNA_ORIENTATION=+